MAVLELNDWNLQLFKDDGTLIWSEPAAALYVKDELIFGDRALQGCRLQPQSFADQYLARLGTEPLNNPLGDLKTQADLVYQHLKTIDVNQETTVLVPSHLSNEKLGIFLGIANRAGIAVKNFVDTALAYALDTASGHPLHVLDIESHRASLTQISLEGTQRSVVSNRSFESIGFAPILNGWLNVIANEFIQKTRFDPLHFAQTEQQLYDKVKSYLIEEPQDDLQIELTQDKQNRQATISKGLLIDKLNSKVQQLDFSEVSSLALTPRVLQVPGLLETLRSTVPQVLIINEDELSGNISRLTSGSGSDNVTRTSIGTSSVSIFSSDKSPETSLPRPVTHLLAESHAHHLGHPKIKSSVEALDAPLRPGDKIKIGSKTYLAISAD